MKKFIKQDLDTKSDTFGKYIYINLSTPQLAELYAEYRVNLALAIKRGSGVPFIRDFKEWLENEPIDI